MDQPLIEAVKSSRSLKLLPKNFSSAADHTSIAPGDTHAAIFSEINAPQIRIMEKNFGASREQRKPMLDLLHCVFEEVTGIDE